MIVQAELFRTVAPFLGQGNLFQPTPSPMMRTIEACGLMSEGGMSSKDAVDEITTIGGPIYRQSQACVDKLLSRPLWSLRLVLAWMLREGDAARVAEAYDHALTWRLSLDTHPDWRDIYRMLRSALVRGTLQATARRHGEACSTIPAAEWNALYPVNSGGAVTFSKWDQDRTPSYADVQFDAATVKALWPPASRARAKSRATIKTEGQVRQKLIIMMRADHYCPIPKRQVREQPAFADVPQRMFDRAWTQAVTEAEAPAWGAPGRRPKAPPS